MGYLDTDTYIRTTDLTPVHGNTKRGKYATPEELAKLYATCQSASNRNARDGAILRLMFCLGLRCCEVLAAELADFDRNTGSLLLHGKGRKLRSIFVFGTIRAAMDRWLERRGEHVGALFEVIDWDDGIIHKPISSTLSIWELYDKRCRRAGISRLAPHDARRTACSNLLGLTDSLTVARILGHASLSITAIYDRRNESAARDACELAGKETQS
jgi:integrase